MGRATPPIAVVAVAALFTVACAPLQVVELAVEPTPSSVHVDGEVVEPVPGALELRADRDHKLFFKRDGYRPALVVLQSRAGEAGPRLEPARVEARLDPLAGGGREVTIEREGAP
ncbi:MAG: hypothetical protein ACQGVK_07885 [Myxococcota bacterium]